MKRLVDVEALRRQIPVTCSELGDFGAILLVSRKEWVPRHKWNKSLELFAKYVMPAFQDHEGPAQ